MQAVCAALARTSYLSLGLLPIAGCGLEGRAQAILHAAAARGGVTAWPAWSIMRWLPHAPMKSVDVQEEFADGCAEILHRES
jgi:hypothetical protein